MREEDRSTWGRKAEQEIYMQPFLVFCVLFLTGQSVPKIGGKSLSLRGSGVVQLGPQETKGAHPGM